MAIAGNRCHRCGRVISEEDRDCGKISITPELFFARTGEKPIRIEAFLCGRCNNQIMASGIDDPLEYDRTMIEIFCSPMPEFKYSWRKELEDKDLLVIFNNLQSALLARNITDTCVRDRFTPGGHTCKLGDKAKPADCDNCLRNWLRSTHPRYTVR